MVEPILCYISGSFAWFTTRSLDQQWGDGWDDAPYEHNAGEPYGTTEPLTVGELCECSSCERDWNADGTPNFELVKVAFEGYGLYAPEQDYGPNSKFSVQDINEKIVPWLRSHSHPVEIYAGVTVSEFRRLVESCGGCVYMKVNAGKIERLPGGQYPWCPYRIAISKEPDTDDQTEIDHCECHERDSSYTCEYCKRKGLYGHMEKR